MPPFSEFSFTRVAREESRRNDLYGRYQAHKAQSESRSTPYEQDFLKKKTKRDRMAYVHLQKAPNYATVIKIFSSKVINIQSKEFPGTVANKCLAKVPPTYRWAYYQIGLKVSRLVVQEVKCSWSWANYHRGVVMRSIRRDIISLLRAPCASGPESWTLHKRNPVRARANNAA